MAHWFTWIQDKLDLTWLAPTTPAIPFALTGVSPDQWQPADVDLMSDTRLQLLARTPSGLEARWEVVFFPDTRAIECWGQVRNRGDEDVKGITECLTLDLPLRLPDAFGQEWMRTINGIRFVPTFFPPYDYAVVDRQLLHVPQPYHITNASMEDGRSSGEHLPCVVIADEKQTHGLGFFLEWSGMWRFAIQKEARDFGSARDVSTFRVTTGLRGLDLNLKPGQSLPLPRLLITAFDGNLDDGGNSIRRHIRKHVTPKLNGEETLPPTSFNHFFAFANNFTDELLRPAVEACAAAGLEYFCVDGGWFRDDFRTGIGNWEEGDPAKFPDGIAPFAEFVRSKGVKYGTWFEPEWAHKGSDLYREHPEWFWETPSSTMLKSPTNYLFVGPDFHLMNFGLPEVRQWWMDRIVRCYEEWGVRWIRWDFNQMPRPNWEHEVPAGELGWRQIEHITGLYDTLDDIIEACPDLLLEQCAGGGHRIDLGTVRRGHSFWMNDHTAHSDIVRALQHGLNTFLPGNYPNTNLCQSRHDFTEYDFLSHAAGGFGYSGKLWEAPPADAARFADAIKRYKDYRHILLGDYHRPTGQPARADEYAKVVFSDAGRSATMEFNVPGEARQAALTVT